MILRQTTDREEIKAVLCHPVIYDTITSDDSPEPENFEPPINKNYRYIGGYVNSKIMALMIYHKYRDGEKCHVQVLPEYRKEYALNFGEQSLTFKGTHPLYAEIPDYYKNVLDFAKLFNFEVIEVKKNHTQINGKFYNSNILRLKDGFF